MKVIDASYDNMLPAFAITIQHIKTNNYSTHKDQRNSNRKLT